MLEKALREMLLETLRAVVHDDLREVLRGVVREELAAALVALREAPVPASTRPKPDSNAGSYVRARDVCRRFGVSRTTLYRWTIEGTIPAPIKLGNSRAIFWKLSDLERWEGERRARAQLPVPPPRPKPAGV